MVFSSLAIVLLVVLVTFQLTSCQLVEKPVFKMSEPFNHLFDVRTDDELKRYYQRPDENLEPLLLPSR